MLQQHITGRSMSSSWKVLIPLHVIRFEFLEQAVLCAQPSAVCLSQLIHACSPHKLAVQDASRPILGPLHSQGCRSAPAVSALRPSRPSVYVRWRVAVFGWQASSVPLFRAYCCICSKLSSQWLHTFLRA
jgi:hypothetical protein